jgi:alkylation response protein AidB-like acyl-CoA dehydrogenase
MSFAKHAAGDYEHAGEPLTRLPIAALALPLIAPLLGLGMAVYDLVVEKLVAGRPAISPSSSHPLAVDSPGVQANVADAAVLLDSAALHAGRAAGDVDRAMFSGEPLSPVASARLRVDSSYAARQVRRAVELLLDVGGASGFAESSATQRLWRDLGTASHHPAFGMEINREPYGRLLLGRR